MTSFTDVLHSSTDTLKKNTDDPNEVGSGEETTSTHATLEEARIAARKVLREGWDENGFDEYKEAPLDDVEERDDDLTGLEVWALCPEGEVMTVHIEKLEVPAEMEIAGEKKASEGVH